MRDDSFGSERGSAGRVKQTPLKEPLVSIVTPFYNTGEFLEECIQSVLRQTYQNWEYVLVNNCSSDGSCEVAARYASRFPDKIRLIHNKSLLSQVQNYNFALTCIAPESKYCKMVQADDWIFPECVSRMVEVAEAHPTVGIVGAYELCGESVQMDGLPYPSPQVSGRDACRLFFLKDKYLFGSPTSLMMRSEVTRSRVPFYEERFAPFEDAHACYDLLRSWNFGFVHQVLTYSRRQDGSILSQIQPFGWILFSRFAAIVAHGRDYLSDREYQRVLQDAERRYLGYLAKSVFTRRCRNREFWEFHRRGLASINYALGWRLLWKQTPRALLERLWEVFWCRWGKQPSSISERDMENSSSGSVPNSTRSLAGNE